MFEKIPFDFLNNVEVHLHPSPILLFFKFCTLQHIHFNLNCDLNLIFRMCFGIYKLNLTFTAHCEVYAHFDIYNLKYILVVVLWTDIKCLIYK